MKQQPLLQWSQRQNIGDLIGLAEFVDLLLRQREADPLGPYAGRVATWLSQLDGFPSDVVATAVCSSPC